MKKFSVGRVDGKLLTKEQSGLGRELKKRKFETEQQAESFIDVHLNKICSDMVFNGEFYLDAPEVR